MVSSTVLYLYTNGVFVTYEMLQSTKSEKSGFGIHRLITLNQKLKISCALNPSLLLKKFCIGDIFNVRSFG